MDREDIIAMAREAEATPYTNRHFPDRPFHTFSPEQLERFFNLATAAEREACAVAAEKQARFIGYNAHAEAIAAAIRARGQA